MRFFPCTVFHLLGGVYTLHEDSLVCCLRDSPDVTEEKVLSSWSSIYNKEQSSIFIFKCKNKKVIYMDVWIYVSF